MCCGAVQYLSLLNFGADDLSPLLYDINQEITFLHELGLLSSCINLEVIEPFKEIDHFCEDSINHILT